ncbi:hypothetical protein Ahy_B08g092487 [Arachis hypogaea]|uniref:Zinc knuckle CX2CX4HX4C domain-containing protein n=1 Tax=Arachis hypogaea TaxID=3818 RepID=A0A444Y3Z6_ARAHY|nr:hypothetical protein Ahy_B08g092487 [Arachis hypogaea]
MLNIGRKLESFQMKEIQSKLFQFFFKKEADMKKIQQTWSLTAEVKVQIKNLLEYYKTVKLGRQLAAVVGEVMEYNLFEGENGKKKFIKAKIRMKIDQPVKMGTNIGCKIDGITWVDFKYEKLPTFCYFCRMIGHDEGICEKAEEQEGGSQSKSKELEHG